MGSSLLDTAKELFSLIDKQQKGYILKEELSQITDDFTDSQLHSVFSALDKDGEGKITLDDFADAFVALTHSQYEENGKQSADEVPGEVHTGPAREDCSPLHDNSTYYTRDTGTNELLSGISDSLTDSCLGLADSAVNAELDESSEKSKSHSSASTVPMFNEHCRDGDDVFEGEGLRADEQTFGTSPSRPQYLRSPSLHKRKGTISSNDPCDSYTKAPEITDRSPPDGNEEDHSKRRRSARKPSKTVILDKQKSVKTQVCVPSSGFAKDAILDVLKIVDSHTIANLGLYDNSRTAWRRTVNMDSPNIFGKDYHERIGTWSATISNRDCEGLNNAAADEPRLCFQCEHNTVESEVCSDDCARGYSRAGCIHCGAGSNCPSDDGTNDSRLGGLFSPSSACAEYAYSDLDEKHQLDDRDSNENIFTFEDRSPQRRSENNRSPYISAKVEKETIGNMIFDDECERREYLYDRILSLSGVELNSRLSSSESSLHDLILEAEVARKSAALVEDWESVMKRVNGVSLFGGNQVIRYLWQQLSVYHTDLLQPFEDFIKSVIAEINRAYAKCQELENMLQSKAEQHERDVARVYDDMENLLSREKEQFQKNQAEREEHLRVEFNRITDMKDADLMDALRSKVDIESKLEKTLQEYHSLKMDKEKLEKQLGTVNAAEAQMRSENDHLTQENIMLTSKLKSYAQSVNELQEQLIRLSKVAEANKENYSRCYRKYQDALEEKEFFDMNVSNLTQELQDLRNANKTLQDRVDSSLNTSILWRDGQTSPRLQHSLELCEGRQAQPFGFPNGIMPISKSQRNSLVSEPSFDESLPDVTVGNAPVPVPDVIPTRIKAGNSPPKSASTPVKGEGHNRRVEKTTQEAIQTTPVQHTGQEYKVVFVGDAAVGKTSLIRKMSRGTFSSRRETTSSPDFVKKIVTVNSQSIALNIWDTVGQERCSYILKVEGFAQQLTFRFNSLPPSYFRKADVVVLVYDIIEKASFLNVKSWIKTIYDYTDENALLVLCGNKSDLDHKRQVKEERAVKFAKINDAIYIESSAKTGYNVAELCETIASTLLERDDTVVIRETSVTMLHQDLLNMSRPGMKSCC